MTATAATYRLDPALHWLFAESTVAEMIVLRHDPCVALGLSTAKERGPRMISVGMRTLLVAFSGLTALAFVALFVGSEHTADYFAWTIQPPLTSAFLGAAYGAGCVMVVLALRVGTWPATRIPFLSVLLFTLGSLLATLLHLDRFHFGASGFVARAAAWIWLLVYLAVPLIMIVLLLTRRFASRRNAEKPFTEDRDQFFEDGPLPLEAVASATAMSVPLRLALIVQGVLFVSAGALLFAAPRLQALLWPWTLTPLTARAVASWLLAFGLAALLSVRAADLAPLGVIATAYAVLAGLELIALLRYLPAVRWESPAAWIFSALMITMALVSFAGLRGRRRPRPRPRERSTDVG